MVNVIKYTLSVYGIITILVWCNPRESVESTDSYKPNPIDSITIDSIDPIKTQRIYKYQRHTETELPDNLNDPNEK